MMVYAFFLFSFYLGLLGRLVTQLGDKNLRGHGLMLGSGIVAAIIWTNMFPSYVAIVPVVLIFTSLCFFLLGFGLFLGGLLRRLPAKSWLKRVTIATSLALPAALSLWSAHEREAQRNAQILAKQVAVAAFQKQVLTAKFGTHIVSFPVTPHLSIRHKCREHKSVCSTRGNSEGLNMARADDLELVSIYFSAGAPMSTWCQRQTDLTIERWCDAVPVQDYHFVSENHIRVPLRQADGATVYPAPAGLETLACFDAFQGPKCIAVIEVAAGIQARIRTLGVSPQEAGRRAAQMRSHIDARWRAMQSET